MKVYFHLNIGGFSNCYLIVNEETNEAIIVDPGHITEELISQIEDNHLKLTAVLITHNHGTHVGGLRTLRKIYNPKIYAADWEVAGKDTFVISGDGKTRIAKMLVRYMILPGHSSDSVVYNIGNILFTGDVLSAGELGTTNSSYSEYILRSNIEQKIYSQLDDVVVMPGHGPPSTLGAIKAFNYDLKPFDTNLNQPFM